MQTVLIVIHILVVLALITVVLLQKSEGGALGMGGGGGFMTSRGSGNVLTKTTAILAGIFFATSLLLSILAGSGRPGSIFRGGSSAPATAAGGARGAAGTAIEVGLPRTESQRAGRPALSFWPSFFRGRKIEGVGDDFRLVESAREV
jgi:preprotein translocase subunit SecG